MIAIVRYKGAVMDSEIEDRIFTLAEEMKKLMEENFLKPREVNEGVHARLKELADEIVSYGFYFERTFVIDPLKPGKLIVEIAIYKPKANLGPEEKKFYDDWFLRRNGLK